MKTEKNTGQRVEQALSSLEGIRRAEPQPWLFARIKRRLGEEEDRTIWGSIGSFIAKPAVVIAGLCLVLVMNGFFLFVQEQQSPASVITEQPVDSESLMASSSSFDYENLVQQ